MNAKTTSVLVWIAIALGVVAYAAVGTLKVLGTEQMKQAFTYFNLPLWFMTFIGVCEVAGAIGLLIRRLSALAALGLAIIMVGAIYMHLTYDAPPQAAAPAVLLVLMLFVAWQRRPRAAI
jgi:putative oxidoreductase